MKRLLAILTVILFIATIVCPSAQASRSRDVWNNNEQSEWLKSPRNNNTKTSNDIKDEDGIGSDGTPIGDAVAFLIVLGAGYAAVCALRYRNKLESKSDK